ncbi:protein polybromo isoform X4 [Leptinotarsa decemlineata]|uniref:protein polybromo isoform X4 n=1 Tax=Leptinotarsa decemlineata TaxID=7539 RepID=UPI003D30637A
MNKRRRASSVSYRYQEEDSLDSLEASTSSGPTMRKRKKYFDPMEACQQLIDILRNHKKEDGSLLSESFIRVPKRRQEPAYYDVVSNPIDLLKIQQKLKMDEYDDIDDLQSDVELIVNNTKAFYKKNSQEFKDATELWDLFISSKNRIIGVEDEPKPVNNKQALVKNSKRSVSKVESKNTTNHDEDGNTSDDSNFDDDGTNPFEELFEAVMTAKDDNKKLLHPAFQLLPSKKKYPDYYEVVEQPVDLKMVALKVQNNKYKFLIEMERDLLLMCKNACLYNEPGSHIYKQAKVLRKIIQMKRIEIDQGRSLPPVPTANSTPVRNSANKNSGTPNSLKNSTTNKSSPLIKNALNKSSATPNTKTSNSNRNSATPNGNRSATIGRNNATPIGRRSVTPVGNRHSSSFTSNRNSLSPHVNKSGATPNSVKIGSGGGRHKRKKGGTSFSATTSVLKDNYSDAEAEPDEDPRAASLVDLNNPQWKLFEAVRIAVGSNGAPLCDPFWKLPSRRLYPDYYREIKNPMSLGQIRRKLVLKLYGTVSEVAGDLTIMFENAKKYNIATSKLYKDAVKLQTLMQAKVQELLDVDQVTQRVTNKNRKIFTETTPTEEPVRRKPGPKPKNPTPGPHTPSRGRPPKDSMSLKKKLHTLAKYMLDYTCEDGRKPMLAFMEKPSKKLYPGYYKVIAEPIDFLEIESKIKAEQYSCENDLVNDFKLMFSNCRQFNEENSPIYEDANLLEKILIDKISQLKPITVTPEKPKRERIVLKPYKPRRILSPLERTLKSLYESIRYYREPKDNRQLSQIFMKLPSKIDYPDYYEVITHPIDMEKMAHRIRANDYENLDELVADFVLMFDNACKYNEPDSQIYKDALVLQRFLFQTKMQLKEDDNTVPDFQAAVQDIFLNLFTNVYNYQDDEGRCYSDSMSDIPEHDEVDGKKVRALSLDLLKRRLDKGVYKRLDTFQEDFFACMNRARRLSRTDSQIFEDAIELQMYFIKQRDELCRHGELLSSPALCFSEADAKAAIEQVRVSKTLKESLEDETETRSSEDSLIKEANSTVGESMTCNQRTFKVGEFVYLDAKEKGCEPHILYIERLWENNGQQMLYGNYYLRPAETYHLTTRKFLEREVFKSDSHVAVPLEEVRDRCCVVNVKYYFTMRPEGYEEKDIYVCESRYSTRLRSFKKIKIYPENPTLKLVPREEPLQPKRVMSVFRERVEKHKDELQELEDLEKLEERDKPNVVAFHSMDIDDGNTYYEQFNTICSGVVKTGDYVYVVAEGGKQIIAQIDSIWETKDGKCYFRGPWFITPSEIPHSPNRLFYKQEVFLSSLEDANPIVSIIGKCSVLEVNDFITYRLTEIPESDVLICTSMYDEINRQVKKLPADGLKKYSHPPTVTEDEIYFFTKILSPPKVSLAVKKPEEPKSETPSTLKVEPSPQFTKMNDMDILMEDSLDGGPPSVGSGEIPVVVPTPGTATPVISTPAPTKKKSNKNKVVTGYILYSREVRKQIVQNNPESTFGDISRIVGSEWKSLPQHEKQQWEEKASKLNEETKAMLLLEEQCSSPAAPPPPPVDVVYECLWDNCDYQFEEVVDLIEHCIKDKESQGHVQAFYTENQISEFNCYWRNCGRNKKNVQPFPNIQRLIRHVRDMHINKGNGRSVPPENRSKNFKPSSKQVVSRPSSSATPNLPVSTTNVLSPNTQKIQEPMFISVPPRPQRVLHSEAYIKYIEGLQAETKHITPWERSLQATQENTPAPDLEKLQNIAAWLGRKADQHDNVVAALWSLRNQLLKDTLGLHKTL